MNICNNFFRIIKNRIAPVAVVVLSSNWALAAGPNILPGLWENKIEMSSKSGQIEAALEQAKAMLEAMPPAQQQMMKDMMVKRGVNFDFGNSTAQSCLTQEQIDDFSLTNDDNNCTHTVEEVSSSHYEMDLQCNQGMTGTGEFFITNNKSYTGNIVMDIDMGGQKDTMTMKQVGTWLSSDCGNISPQ